MLTLSFFSYFSDVAYLFQDLKTLESENEGDTTQEYSVDLDETLPSECEIYDLRIHWDCLFPHATESEAVAAILNLLI